MGNSQRVSSHFFPSLMTLGFIIQGVKTDIVPIVLVHFCVFTTNLVLK